MNQIPTAEEFLQQHPQISHYFDDETGKMVCFDDDVKQAMIEFAKMHLKLAKKEIVEKATMNLRYPEPYQDSNDSNLFYVFAHEINRGGENGSVTIDDDSILNAYPLTNIK